MQSSIIVAALRTTLQSWWGIVAGWLASLGITISAEQSVIVLGLLTAVGIGLATAAIRWLESRQGGEFWPSLARKVASVLMLGLNAQPVYEAPKPVAVKPSRNGTQPPLGS